MNVKSALKLLFVSKETFISISVTKWWNGINYIILSRILTSITNVLKKNFTKIVSYDVI